MKKYKLIKEYPGSPKLETIVEEDDGAYYIPDDDSKSSFTELDHYPYSYPEFWEEVIEYPINTKAFNNQTKATYIKKEDGWYKTLDKTAYTDEMITKTKFINIIEDKVVEKDYEILEVKGKYGAVSSYIEILDSDLKDKTIFKIKRLSDGEIFTIGDESNNGIIKSIFIPFEFGTATVCIQCDNKKGIYLKDIIKYKQPLFTTEDGVDIFEDDKFIVVNIFTFNKHRTDKYLETNHMYKYFSTKEKAEEYILLNKPCLSLNDLKQLFPDTYIPFKKGESATEDINTQQLENLVKSKINNK